MFPAPRPPDTLSLMSVLLSMLTLRQLSSRPNVIILEMKGFEVTAAYDGRGWRPEGFRKQCAKERATPNVCDSGGANLVPGHANRRRGCGPGRPGILHDCLRCHLLLPGFLRDSWVVLGQQFYFSGSKVQVIKGAI